MNLLNELMNTAGSGDLQKLGSQFGLDESAVSSVMKQVVPALGQGLKTNATSAGGLDSLIAALQNGNHGRYVEDINAATGSAGIAEGNNILGHILGSKDASRAVASQASSASGVSPDVIKKTDGGAKLQAAADNPLGGLAGMLDMDGDGSAMDDVMDIAKKFF